ncbi:MAG: hypothetical protein KJO50_08065, partial [Bacteroidia bacterium]|nr:hypothetical protein [Bacteroidia bacterium]
MKKALFIFIAVLIMLSCHRKHAVLIESDNLSALILEHENWKRQRHLSLTKADNWLSLVGLSWLKKGENFMGSGSDCNISLSGEYPEKLGKIILNDSIFFETLNEKEIYCKGERFYSGQLRSDANPPYTTLTYQSLRWYIIKRDNKYGVRIKDTLASTRMNFKGIEYFPYSESMVLEVKVEETHKDSVQITNVLGFQSDNPIEAFLCFSYDDKDYKLSALDGG